MHSEEAQPQKGGDGEGGQRQVRLREMSDGAGEERDRGRETVARGR